MSDFDLAATVAYVDANAQPKGNFGCVYELWQEARNREAYSLLGHVPDEHYDATVEALKAKGVIEEVGQPPEGLCQHWLDANTCPLGCFEGDEREPDIEDHGDRHDPYELYGLTDLDAEEVEDDEEDEPDWDEGEEIEPDEWEPLPEMAEIVNIHEKGLDINGPDIRDVQITSLERQVRYLRLALAAVSVLAVIGLLG